MMVVFKKTVYDFGMAKFIHVQIKGVEKPAYIKADKAEDDENEGLLRLKLGKEEVGVFRKDAVLGWWQSENDSV